MSQSITEQNISACLFVCRIKQNAVDKLIADVGALAAPGSLFHFDFLHLDVLEGRSPAVGYANTAKASAGDLACFSNRPNYQRSFCTVLPELYLPHTSKCTQCYCGAYGHGN